MGSGGNDLGFLSVLPSLTAIVLAIATHRVLPSLLAGIGIAVWLLPSAPGSYLATHPDASGLSYAWGACRDWVVSMVGSHLWPNLNDSKWDRSQPIPLVLGDHAKVFLFTIFLGAQVSLIHRMGGMLAIVRSLAPLARTRRRGQALTWLLGLIIFIDDYANTLLLGSSMRPLTDRLRISREKLSFIVDSTAAPVSGLALVSTWVATELSLIEKGFADAGMPLGTETFAILVATIPFRFYVLFMLAFVWIVAWTGKDFGPMLKAEQSMWRNGVDEKLHGVTRDASEQDATNGRWWFAVIPIMVTVGWVCYWLWKTGVEAVAAGNLDPGAGWLRRVALIIGNGNSYDALMIGSLLGLLVAAAIAAWKGAVAPTAIGKAILDGTLHVAPALAILWLSWTLSHLSGEEHLATGNYLASLLDNRLPLWAYPTLIFLLGAAVAFATGTSWGTMGILFPIAIPLVVQALKTSQGSVDPYDPIMISSLGAVLAGAIFGDHCSPISDTTILSSRSSQCHHMEHVRTQMPYALLSAVVAVLCGTLPCALGVPASICLLAGLAVLFVFLHAFGGRAEDPVVADKPATGT